MIKSTICEHKGWMMRSHTEYLWAKVMDCLGIGYLHEPDKFNTRHGWYLPDFYLPRLGAYVEIKGVEPTQVERDKAEDLISIHGKSVFFISGKPEPDRNGFSGCSAWFFWGGKWVRIPMCLFSDIYISEFGQAPWMDVYSNVKGDSKGFVSSAAEAIAECLLSKDGTRGFYEEYSASKRDIVNRAALEAMPLMSASEKYILEGIAAWKERKSKSR